MLKAKIVSMFTLLLVALLVTSSLTHAVSSEEFKWDLDDVWSAGFEDDIKNFNFPGVELDIEESMKHFEEIQYEIDGEGGYYTVMEVLEKDEDHFQLNIKGGGGVHVTMSTYIEGEFITEGTYHQPFDPPVEDMIIDVKGNIHLVNSFSGTMVVEKRNLTIESFDYYSHWRMRGRLEGENITFHNFTDDIQTYRYEDVDITFQNSSIHSINVDFLAPLNLIDIPPETDQNWSMEVPVDIEGAYGGRLYYLGLPEHRAEEILGDHGADKFPIYFDEVETGREYAHDGVIEQVEKVLYLRGAESDPNITTPHEEDIFVINCSVDMGYDPEMTFKLYLDEEANTILAHEWLTFPYHEFVKEGMSMESFHLRPVPEEIARERMDELNKLPYTPVEMLINPPYAYYLMFTLLGIAIAIYAYKKLYRDPKKIMRHEK